MTRSQIETALPTLHPIFGGLNYASPTLSWVTGAFWSFFQTRLWDDSIKDWAVKWECRDFSRAYACYAQECNALTPDSPVGMDALSIGEFWFHPDANPPGENHAINVIIADGKVTYIDPQNGSVWAITPTEYSSCTFCRF